MPDPYMRIQQATAAAKRDAENPVKHQYQNNANWFQRNIWSPVKRGIQNIAPNSGILQLQNLMPLQQMPAFQGGNTPEQYLAGKKVPYHSQQQFMFRNYGDAGSKDQNFKRYTPWVLSREQAQKRYYIPNSWYNKNGGIKKQYNQAYREKFRNWQADARANGYSADPRIWMLMSQSPVQKQNILNGTNTEAISLRVAQAQLRQNAKDLQFAIKNAPQGYTQQTMEDGSIRRVYRKQQLYKELLNNIQMQQQLKEKVNNLSSFDKFRYDIMPWSLWVATPGALVYGANPYVFALSAATAAADPAIKGIVRYANQDRDKIADAIASNDYSQLTQAQLAKVPEYKKQYGYNGQNAAQVARRMQQDTEDSARNWNMGADAVAWLTPWGWKSKLKGQGLRAIRQQARQFARQVRGNAGPYIFWSGGQKALEPLTGKESYEYSKTVAAAQPKGFRGNIRSDRSAVGQMFLNAAEAPFQHVLGSVGAMGFAGPHIPGPSQWMQSNGWLQTDMTSEDMENGKTLAKLKYGQNATPQQAVQMAQAVRNGRAVQTARRRIHSWQRAGFAPATRAGFKSFVNNIKNTKALPEQQREKALQKIFSSGVSIYGQAQLRDMLQDPKARQDFAAFLAQDPYVLTKILQSKGQNMSTIKEVLASPVFKKVTQNYVVGLDKAKSKIEFARQYIPLFRAAKDMVGQDSEAASQLEDYTRKQVWAEVQDNPWLINQAVALYIDYFGQPQVANLVRDNGVFYGTAAAATAVALPLTASLMSSLFNRNGTAAQTKQALPSPEQGFLQQGYQPLSYAPQDKIHAGGLVVR